MTATPRPPGSALSRLLPTRKGWWLVAAAFLAGFVLFLLLWAGQRRDVQFHRADAEAPATPGQVFEPLPVPMPADGGTASGMDSSAQGQAPRIDGHASAPEAVASLPAIDSDDPPQPDAGLPAGADTQPRAISMPPPDYPRSAMRRGIGGDVVLMIEVRPNGRTGAVEVETSSGDKSLDRAAIRAVRRWRFDPAMQGETPVAATVRQTISFTPP